MILWDASGTPPAGAETVWLWNGHADQGGAQALLRYCEEHGERLRRKYLAWVHDAGQARVAGQRLVDRLAFADGLSYWWLTGFVEKSPYRSPITDAVRLFAIEEIIVAAKPGGLRLVSDDRTLAGILERLCQRLGIEWCWDAAPPGAERRHGEGGGPQPHRRLALRALLRQVSIALRFRGSGRHDWFAGDRATLLCGYFVNVVPEAADQGRFHSRYWERLPVLLRLLGRSTNWLHHNVAPAAATAQAWVRRFNHDRAEQGCHIFLDAYLSVTIVVAVVRRWLWLNWICWRLGSLDAAFQPADSQLSLWPLVRERWRTSLIGADAISNLLAIGLFDAALRTAGRQPIGLYLCEHNAWEPALIHAWRRHGHGRLIGVAHSTVRFWDLRYFMDFRAAGAHPRPMPDVTAVNGAAAIAELRDGGYPAEVLAECEAVRYIHGAVANRTRREQPAGDGVPRVLIIGDIMASFTSGMLKLLEAAAPSLPPLALGVKAHPATPVRHEDYPALTMTAVSQPLGESLAHYDIAYASSSTSGAVDAWLAGLPVIVMLDAGELNFSPLRGRHGVRFVSTPAELADAIHTASRAAGEPEGRRDFFFLDPELPRWRQLLTLSDCEPHGI